MKKKTINSQVQQNNQQDSAFRLLQYFLSEFDLDSYLKQGGDESVFMFGMAYFEKLFGLQGEFTAFERDVSLTIEHLPKTTEEIALEINKSPKAVARIIHYLARKGFLSSQKTSQRGKDFIYHRLNAYGRQRVLSEVVEMRKREEILGIKIETPDRGK